MTPWPWLWIGSYCIPSCITHRPLPTCQISLQSKKLFVDEQIDVRTYVRADGQTFETNFTRSIQKSRPIRRVDLINILPKLNDIFVCPVWKKIVSVNHSVSEATITTYFPAWICFQKTAKFHPGHSKINRRIGSPATLIGSLVTLFSGNGLTSHKRQSYTNMCYEKWHK